MPKWGSYLLTVLVQKRLGLQLIFVIPVFKLRWYMHFRQNHGHTHGQGKDDDMATDMEDEMVAEGDDRFPMPKGDDEAVTDPGGQINAEDEASEDEGEAEERYGRNTEETEHTEAETGDRKRQHTEAERSKNKR